jgi:hypothetical protein
VPAVGEQPGQALPHHRGVLGDHYAHRGRRGPPGRGARTPAGVPFGSCRIHPRGPAPGSAGGAAAGRGATRTRSPPPDELRATAELMAGALGFVGPGELEEPVPLDRVKLPAPRLARPPR